MNASIDYSEMPAVAPPLGVTSNFVDPPSLAGLPRIFFYTTFPPMVIFLGMRFYSRITIARQVGVDDYLTLLAALTMTGHSAALMTVLDKPAGPHMWDIPRSKITAQFAEVTVIASVLYFFSAMLAKCAILLMYRRLFRLVYLVSVLVWIGIVSVAIFHTVVIVLICVACIPRAEDFPYGGWLSVPYSNRCNAYNGYVAAVSGVGGSLFDIYILIIPVILIWGLRASVKRKFGIFAIFLVGSAACVFSITGAVFRVKLLLSQYQDSSWIFMQTSSMNIGEIDVGIACSCMPVVLPLFRDLSKKSSVWASKLRNMTSSGRKASQDSRKYSDVREDMLPQIPKATMTGLRSFIRRCYHTNATRTQTEASTADTLTYVSADYDYHEQLKGEPKPWKMIHSNQSDGDKGAYTHWA